MPEQIQPSLATLLKRRVGVAFGVAGLLFLVVFAVLQVSGVRASTWLVIGAEGLQSLVGRLTGAQTPTTTTTTPDQDAALLSEVSAKAGTVQGISDLDEQVLEFNIETLFNQLLTTTGLAVTGNSTLDGDVDVAGDLTVENLLAVLNDLTIGGDLTLNGNTLNSQGDLLVNPGGGGVSIGTGTPGIDMSGGDLYVTGDLEVDGSATLGTTSITTATINSATISNATISTGTFSTTTTDTDTIQTAKITNLTINGETFTDLTGTGLVLSGGALTALLGDSITTDEIVNGTILAADFNASNTPNPNNVLIYNDTTGGFEWVDNSIISPWTDATGYIYANTTGSNDVVITDTGYLGLGTTSPSNGISLADNYVLDLSLITHNDSARQGLKLPQNTTLSTMSGVGVGEGYLAYDTTVQKVKVFNGTSWTDISGASTTLQEAYEALNTLNVTTGEGDLAVTLTSADFTIDTTGGSVGIGTTSPGTTLDVAGSTTLGASSGHQVIFNAGDLSLVNQSTLDLVDSTVNALSIESGLLSFDTTNSRLGVGTTTPTALLDLAPTQTSGTIFNIHYPSSTNLTGDLTGAIIDLDDGTVIPTNQNVTSLNAKLPTTTNTHTTGTKYLRGVLANFGTGSGINQTGAGGTTIFNAFEADLPALTQSAGSLSANGIYIDLPSGITTAGTATGVNINATGVGAGSLYGAQISSITPGAGTEYALSIGSGWDSILRVNGTEIMDSSGVTQEAGGGTGQSTYTQGDILYASAANTLSKLAIGSTGYVLTVSGSGVPTWGTVDGSTCVTCILNNPSSNQTISPTADAVGLSVRQSNALTPTADIFSVASNDGLSKYFYVDADGVVNIPNVGSFASDQLIIEPGTDKFALQLLGTNVTSASLQLIDAYNTSGTLFDIDYPAAAVLSGTLYAQDIDLGTNLTATNQSVYGTNLTLPSTTNTHTTGTKYLTGLKIQSAGGLNQNGTGGTTTFSGLDITIPALTQTAGTINGYGLQVTTPSSITSGGTAAGLLVNASGVGAGTLYGIDISGISPGAGTQRAVNIGAGWPYGIYSQATENYFSGEIGIGTTSPASALDVRGEIKASKVNKVVVVDGITYPQTCAGINQAIDALGSAGGEIYLPEGTYTCAETITIDYNNTTIRGAGWGTYLNASGNNLNPVINVNAKAYVTLQDFKITHGSGGSGGHTISSPESGASGADKLTISHLQILNSDDTAIYLSNVRNSWITRNDIQASDSYGLYVRSWNGGSNNYNNIIENNFFLNTGNYSIYQNASINNTYRNNYITTPATTGIAISSGDYSIITGNQIKDDGTGSIGIWLYDSDYSVVNHNLVSGFSGVGDTGISVHSTSLQNHLAYNHFYNNTSNIGDGSTTTQITQAKDGYLGIGTTNPLAKLEVKGSSDANQLSIMANGTQSNSNQLLVLKNSAGSVLSGFHADHVNSLFLGVGAGENNNITGIGSEGLYNIFVGPYAGNMNTTGAFNTTLGNFALYTNDTGSHNTAVGYSALYFTDGGSYNTGLGRNALEQNTTGNDNVGVGFRALARNSTGSGNTGVGVDVGNPNSGGSYSGNSLLGYRTGYLLDTGSNNTLLGYQAGNNLTTGSNNIVLGYDIDAPSATSTQTLNIGNLLFGTGLDGTGTTLSTGSIGIGTTAPGYKLDVVSGAAIAGQFDGRVIGSDAVNTNEFVTLGQITTGSSGLWTRNGTDTYLTNTGDSVGIGTTSPSYKLDILDTGTTAGIRGLNVSQTGAIAGTGYAGYFSKTGASTTNVGLYATATGATNNYAAIFESGRVGIGTTSPQFTLDVRETTTSTSSVTLNSSILTANPSANTANGYYSFYAQSNSAPGNNKNIGYLSGGSFLAQHLGSGTVSEAIGLVGANVNSSGTTTLAKSVSSINIMTGGSITNYHGFYSDLPTIVSGTITSMSGISVENLNLATNNTHLLMGTSTIPSGNWGIYNASTYNNYVAGSVGIGTTSPGSQLQINTGSASTVGQIIQASASQTANLLELRNSSGTGLSAFDENGKLGIGTNNPQYDLDIIGPTGSMRIDGPSDVLVQFDRSATTENTALTFGTNGTINWALTTPNSTSDFYISRSAFTPASYPDLVIQNSTGNVGIGTTTPATKLNVSGNGTYTFAAGGISLGDGDTGFYESADDTLITQIAGSNELGLTSTALYPTTASGLALGSTTNEWSALYLGDDTGLNFGLDQDFLLAYDETTDDRLELTATNKDFYLGLGTGKLNILGTSTQLRLGYDASNYTNFTVGSDGSLVLASNGTTGLTVSSSKITSHLPHEFLASGDVSMAYDLNFTNITSSTITSDAPLLIAAGESFNSDNLTLQTYNTGDVVLDLGRRLYATTDNASGYVAEFYNDGNNANRYGLKIQAGADDASGTTYYLDAYDGDGNQVGYLANTSGTFAITDVSDIRTKVNINDTRFTALDVLSDLRVVDFNRKQDPDGPQITGFIAQEVAEVFPEAVTVGADGMLGIRQASFIPLTIKAIQEQQLQLATIDESGQVLGAKIDELGNYVWGSAAQDQLSTNETVSSLSKQVEVLTNQLTGLGDGDLTTLITREELGQNMSWTQVAISVLKQLVVKAAATFEQTVTFLAEVTFRSSATFEQAVALQDELKLGQNSAGVVTIPARATEVKVKFQFDETLPEEERHLSQAPVVTLTPVGQVSVWYWLDSVTDREFTIKLATPVDQPVTLNWTAVMTTGEGLELEVVSSQPNPLTLENPDPEAEPTQDVTVDGAGLSQPEESSSSADATQSAQVSEPSGL